MLPFGDCYEDDEAECAVTELREIFAGEGCEEEVPALADGRGDDSICEGGEEVAGLNEKTIGL